MSAREETGRRAAVRARAEAVLESSGRLLDEMRNRQIPSSLWEPSAAAAPAEPAPMRQPARAPAGPAGTAVERIEAKLDALESAIGRALAIERMGWQRRAAEAERRIDALEAKLAEIEGQLHDG